MEYKVKNMTLRDYIATSVTGTQFGVPINDASLIMKEPKPKKGDVEGEFYFWMKWEAFRKYKYADAMIKEKRYGNNR